MLSQCNGCAELKWLHTELDGTELQSVAELTFFHVVANECVEWIVWKMVRTTQLENCNHSQMNRNEAISGAVYGNNGLVEEMDYNMVALHCSHLMLEIIKKLVNNK